MRGTGCEAVVLHREYPGTKQMQRDRLALMVKKMAIKMKVKTNKHTSVVIFMKNMYILESKTRK